MEIRKDEIYNIEETAKLLRVSPQTLRNRISQNKPMPKCFKFGKRVLFPGKELLTFIQQGGNKE